MTTKQARDYHIKIGNLPTGPLNKISDVKGVTVGHVTLKNGDDVNTGVTAILPHQGNIFKQKCVAASHVLNGFGKTVGTIQMNELGTLETPIVLTNTLSVGTCTSGLIKYMLKDNPEIGETTGTINPVVGECNDMHLNNIRKMNIKEEHVFTAIQQAQEDFEEGAIGAGTGMKCFGLKGGIGSSSRIIEIESVPFTIGVLVLSNFGKLEDLSFNGKKVGAQILDLQSTITSEQDKGSIMMIIATDLPVTDRQLKRIIKRCSVGLSRTGSTIGHGSGDIALGFSTTNMVPHFPPSKGLSSRFIHEEQLDQAFKAVADATEEAILNSMLSAKTTTGYNNHTVYSLNDYISKILKVER